MSEVKGNYSLSKNQNFRIIDTIGVPHPYCLTPKHVAVASDNWGGMLGENAIRDAEKKGAKCDICRKSGKILSYDEHEQALLVECKIEISPIPKELKTWLVSIKDEATANGYVGFAFKEANN